MLELPADVVGTLGEAGAVPVETGTETVEGFVGTTGSVPGAEPVGTTAAVELAGVEYGTLLLVVEADEVFPVLALLETETLRAGGPQLKATL